jgi:hypothetical protein
MNRDELIRQIVDKFSEGLTYEDLLQKYRDKLIDSLKESTDEELVNLAKFPIAKANGEISEVTKKDMLLTQKKVAEAVLESSDEREIEEKIKKISSKMSLANSKRTFEELQLMARISLKDANEELNKLEGENNGNN